MRIENKKGITEFELQAELFMRIKNEGYLVRGEITDTSIRSRFNNTKGFRQCRFDIVIFEGDEAKIIIEVKNPKKPINKGTRQYQKYSFYNLPIIYFKDLQDIEKVMQDIKELMT